MAIQNPRDRLREELGKVLERIASDPAYRQQVLNDPRQVLSAVGLDPAGSPAEVSGFAFAAGTGCAKDTGCTSSCSSSCSWWSPKTCKISCDITCSRSKLALM